MWAAAAAAAAPNIKTSSESQHLHHSFVGFSLGLRLNANNTGLHGLDHAQSWPRCCLAYSCAQAGRQGPGGRTGAVAGLYELQRGGVPQQGVMELVPVLRSPAGLALGCCCQRGLLGCWRAAAAGPPAHLFVTTRGSGAWSAVGLWRACSALCSAHGMQPCCCAMLQPGSQAA